MQQIGEIATAASQHPHKSSPIVRIADAIPAEKARALGDVLDRWRLDQGWNPWDNATQMAAISSFVHSLDRAGIPYTAYGELYERILRRRALALTTGKELPKFGVELMIAEWEGEYGLRSEIRQREINERRSLPSNAQAQCERCAGNEAGMEIIYDANGTRLGAKKGCDHRPIVEHEGIWKYLHKSPDTIKDLSNSEETVCRDDAVGDHDRQRT